MLVTHCFSDITVAWLCCEPLQLRAITYSCRGLLQEADSSVPALLPFVEYAAIFLIAVTKVLCASQILSYLTFLKSHLFTVCIIQLLSICRFYTSFSRVSPQLSDSFLSLL